MKLKELADLIEGQISGDPEVEIYAVCGIEEAKEGDITYVMDKKSIGNMKDSKASAVIVKQDIKAALSQSQDFNIPMITVENPQLGFAKALEVIYLQKHAPIGISESALIGSDVTFGSDISIYPQAFVSDSVRLGSRVTISPGVYLGEGVKIDDDVMIYPNVTIREKVIIGKNVIIHSGSVIGSDGFGYVMDKGRHYKIPQVGGVIIEDDVEIGANVTIDRATVGNTIIGSGTKIDNLVQIAHNVTIGKNCIIVSQVGISGSVEIGDGVVLAGQVGLRDHIKVGSKAIVGAQSGIANDIPEGQVYSGSPAIPHMTWLRAQSIYAKLPEFIKRIQELERKLPKEE